MDRVVAVGLELTTDDPAAIAAAGRRHADGYAFTFGAMGSGTKNFYNDAFARQGYADDVAEVQRLWAAGDREAAAARVPVEIGLGTNLVGPPEVIHDRLVEYERSGVTTLRVGVDGTFDQKIAAPRNTDRAGRPCRRTGRHRTTDHRRRSIRMTILDRTDIDDPDAETATDTAAHSGSDESTWHKSACILCECNCGVEIRLGPDARTFDRVRGDKDHPASQGYTCEKALRLDHYQNGRGERVLNPLRRRADGTFEEVDWDTAVEGGGRASRRRP